jgi:hypothetical protein
MKPVALVAAALAVGGTAIFYAQRNPATVATAETPDVAQSRVLNSAKIVVRLLQNADAAICEQRRPSLDI